MVNVSTVPLFPMSFYTPISATYCVIAVLAISLNGCALLVFLKNPRLLRRSNFLLLSLTMTDFTINVIATPVAAYANAFHWWTMDPFTCKYYAFVTTWCSLNSILHITALAMERRMTIKLKNIYRCPLINLIVLISGLWCFSLLWSLFPLLGWSSFGPEPGFAGCSVTWYSPSLASKAYIVGIYIFFFFLPIGIIISCFVQIYLEVNKLIKNAAKRWGTGTLPTKRSFKAKIKTIRMSVIMTAAFFVAWTPYAIVSLIAFFTPYHGEPLLNISASMFAKLSTFYNPIIYFFMYNKFRIAAIHMIVPRKNSKQKSASWLAQKSPSLSNARPNNQGLTVIEENVLTL